MMWQRDRVRVWAFVEKVLWRYCQGVGAIDPHSEPSKDKRGGKRAGAGRKPIKSQDEESIEGEN